MLKEQDRRLLPNFIFVGPTRTGSTWIDAYLRQRGDVCLPAQTKETFYFDKQFYRGVDWYADFFPAHSEASCRVEIAPSLFHKPETARRISETLGSVDIVITLRDPIERSVSHYMLHLKSGAKTRGFSEMAERYQDIIEASTYYPHILRWLETFGPEKVHFLLYDDLRGDPTSFAESLSLILGLPKLPPRDHLLSGKENRSSLPRVPIAALVTRKLARNLRKLGFNKLVNAFKIGPLKKAIFSGSKEDVDERTQKLTTEALASHHDLLDDLDELSKIVQRDVSAWRR